MSETKQGTLGYTEDSLGNKVIAIDERFTVVACQNGDIKVRYKDEDIVWVDTYYMGADKVPAGAEHQKGLPSVVVNAVNQDEPSVCLSIGDDKVYVNDIDREITEDKRGGI